MSIKSCSDLLLPPAYLTIFKLFLVTFYWIKYKLVLPTHFLKKQLLFKPFIGAKLFLKHDVIEAGSSV